MIGLADDIARSMSALSARVAVVPGRNAIGIELPNPHREKVYLRELLSARDGNESVAKLMEHSRHDIALAFDGADNRDLAALRAAARPVVPAVLIEGFAADVRLIDFDNAHQLAEVLI